jgi:hypothetical protein
MSVKTACCRAARLALMLLLFWALPAAAQEPVGRAIAKVGSVTVLRAGAGSSLQPGDPLYQIDQVLTGPKARVRIEFLDSSILAIGADSEVAITEYLLDDERARQSALFDLLRGILRATVAGGTAGGFDIRTRIAVASTRAADWLIELTEEKVSVFVVEGQVQVIGYQDGVSKLVEAGFGSDTKIGQRAANPRPWAEDRVNDLLARTQIH